MKLALLCLAPWESACFPRGFRPQLEALESRTLLSVCTVDRLTDNNPTGGGEGGNGMGDLRWCAIESLFQADTIDFAVTGTINLAAALPTLTRSVSIDGPGADLLTVRRDTGGSYRIFTVDAAGAAVGISGLTISNGNVEGGGIYNSYGALTVNNSIISGNAGGGIINFWTMTVNNSIISGNGGAGGGGSGIQNNSSMTINNSTISGNTAGGGGGIQSNNAGTLTINNSTISGNTAGDGGGGGILSNATLAVNNSTISGNSTNFGSGGGILVRGSMSARNTILAGNTAAAGPDVYGNLGSQGHNLIGNPQDMTGWVSSDLLHVNPMLGPLQDNGGPTRTMALLPGSPAIDAGDNTGAPMWDQRGAPFRRIVNGIIDIGAYEVQAGGHGRPTGQPLPDPVAVQGMPDGPLAGQPPDLPADPSPVPESGIPDGQTGQPEPVAVPTAAGPPAPATLFGTDPALGDPRAFLGALSVNDLDALALNMVGGP